MDEHSTQQQSARGPRLIPGYPYGDMVLFCGGEREEVGGTVGFKKAFRERKRERSFLFWRGWGGGESGGYLFFMAEWQRLSKEGKRRE